MLFQFTSHRKSNYVGWTLSARVGQTRFDAFHIAHSTHVGCTLSKTLVDSPTAFSTHTSPCAPSATCLHL